MQNYNNAFYIYYITDLANFKGKEFDISNASLYLCLKRLFRAIIYDILINIVWINNLIINDVPCFGILDYQSKDTYI